MPDTARGNGLIAYSKALEAAGLVLALAKSAPAPSVRDRTHAEEYYGSTREVDCHLRLLAGTGLVDRRRVETALSQFDQVRAMTWRLLHPKVG